MPPQSPARLTSVQPRATSRKPRSLPRCTAAAAPWAGKKRPPILNALALRVEQGLVRRSGPAFTRLARSALVAGYRLADRLEGRSRAFRRDGCEAFAAILRAMLGMTDVRTGIVRPGNAPTEADLASLAFGGRGVAAIKRTSRALDVAEGQGWLEVGRQRRQRQEGGFVAEAVIRRLRLDRIAEAFNIAGMLSHARRWADRDAKPPSAPVLAAAAEGPAATSATTPASAAAADRPAGLPPRAAPSAAGLAALAELRDLFR